MPGRRHSIGKQQQKQQSNHRHCHHHRRHHRCQQQQQAIPQLIQIRMDNQSSKIEFSITSDGPVETTVVIDPSAVVSIPLVKSSSSSSSSPPPVRQFSSSGWNSPVIPDLKPPPTVPLSSTFNRNMPLGMSLDKYKPIEH